MLQRIQTVYLLIIVALTVATLFLPLAVLQQGDALFSFDASGLSTMIGEPELLYPAWGLFALTAIIAIIALVTIFLYKKRINMTIVHRHVIVSTAICSLKGDMEGASVSVKIALSFPLVNLILDYLAIRNIGADEALVRSLDRLR